MGPVIGVQVFTRCQRGKQPDKVHYKSNSVKQVKEPE